MEEKYYDNIDYLMDVVEAEKETARTMNVGQPMRQRLDATDIEDFTNVSSDFINKSVIRSEIAAIVEDLDKRTFHDNQYNYTALFSYISILSVQGYSRKELCKLTGLTPTQFSELTSAQLYKEIMYGMTYEVVQRAKQQMATATMKATRRLVELLDAPDSRVRLAAAKDILDRTGLRSAEEFVIRTEEKQVSGMPVDEAVDALKYGIDEILRSRARIKGEVLDADSEGQ